MVLIQFICIVAIVCGYSTVCGLTFFCLHICHFSPQSISEVLLSHMDGLVELVHYSSENDASRNIALKLYNALLVCRTLDMFLLLTVCEYSGGVPRMLFKNSHAFFKALVKILLKLIFGSITGTWIY